MDVSAKTIKPAPTRSRRTTTAPKPADLAAPRWVIDLLAQSDALPVRNAGLGRQVTAGEWFTLVSVRIANAAQLRPADFENETSQAYAYIASELRDKPARHPVRFWNYIPGIHRPAGEGLDRYMVFNAAGSRLAATGSAGRSRLTDCWRRHRASDMRGKTWSSTP